MIIEFSHLSKRYKKNGKFALYDVNYASDNINPLGIVGSNGAGKSTLFLIANGLARPTSGDVRLYDKSILKDNNLNQKTGLFTDKLVLYQVLTVKETIHYFMGVYGIPKKQYESCIDMFRVKEFEKSRIEELSTGMLKKVMLLISMLNRPKILFLDEPFSGLDMDSKSELSDVINDLYQEYKVKTIISSHDLFETQSLIQDVLIIEEGKVIERGKFNDLINKYMKSRNMNVICEEDAYIINNDMSLEDIYEEARKHAINSNVSKGNTNITQ